MRAVDTNLLVRLIVRDDPAQVAAAEAFVAGAGWVSHLVLAETIWVLDAVHDRSAAQLAAAIEMLLNHEQLSIQDAEVVAQALAQYRSRPALGFSDCLALEIARKAGHLPLGTFDRGLAKLEGAQRL
jgi:predicted nucleic-acid-binding protein